MRQLIEESLPQIINIRHHLHQNPELSFEEYQTAKYVREVLEKLGYTVHDVAKTGLVCILDSGKPGKTVGLRADMDALPLQEETQVEFISKNAQKMHACGHDGHVATLLLVADILRHFTPSFKGKIKFIFQPAEELGLGAKAMIREGVLENPKLDAIFGYHNLPTFPKNQVLVKSDCIMAGRIVIKIRIQGLGGHSSAPERAIDPIYVGTFIVQLLHSMRNRDFSAFDKVVISITKFNAGSAPNIIPSEAYLEGTIRFNSNDLVNEIKNKISKTVQKVAESMGASADVTFPEVAPATINTKQEAELVYQTAKQLFDENRVVLMQENIMASEDFAFFLNEIPGCFFLIGTGEDKCYLHNKNYLFEDDIIPVAAELLAKTAINYLNNVEIKTLDYV